MTLVRAQPDGDDIDDLRAGLRELESTLAARAAEIARAKSDLERFRIRYRREVGQLHEELDELQDAIAEAESAERARHRSDDQPGGAAAGAARPRPEPLPRFTSDAVRKLFRDVAKVVHPDLALDADARDRRHTLMIEANRAYAMGDEERLRWILDTWQSGPDAVQGSDPEAVRQRLVRRISHVQAELARCERELAEMAGSPLGQLKAMVDESAARGKDLMAEMIRRLKRDIMAARNRLDAIQWCP